MSMARKAAAVVVLAFALVGLMAGTANAAAVAHGYGTKVAAHQSVVPEDRQYAGRYDNKNACNAAGPGVRNQLGADDFQCLAVIDACGCEVYYELWVIWY
jgi:hypothetical protein